MKTYIIGHKNPDSDSIVSAIAYADFKNKNGGDAVAARLGNINNEARYILDKCGLEAPELLEDGTDKKLILVDHNQDAQTVDNAKKGEILEVLDHHNINFSYSASIPFHIDPVGAVATLITEKYFETGTKLDEKIARVLLYGILSDTVIFKSPITTERDKKAAEKLAEILEEKDILDLGMELFKAKSVWGEMKIEDIIEMDRKEYDMSGVRVSISQVETVDYKDLESKKVELKEKLNILNESKKLFFSILLITDIIREGCLLIVAGDTTKIEEAFSKKVEDNEVWLDGVLSRKKQVVPLLEELFRK